ncbi:MAG: hypothetical protein UT48_C0046G0004 [Parcubacteria group bacterium GW2011_GWE2_39_37]|uniref:Uncharacterized protein n=1 Tax=Candidatus Falkowbacteria bacterium GW2011_GWF2_39_8 TaxID=1618642 RepID=A0A0G0Q1B5_9BACT|nr:MAG: hypothetical protein UT48_C0046G0004 [Parcubacteria group bacterium GW2011_GWE2_39_37]KKR33958.1 MAG: hypothetical protein UT64_C0001G0032 [Candidatus Falkowbacteria bacterium GW2011_GWF2_39_8]
MNFLNAVWQVIVGCWLIFCGTVNRADAEVRQYVNTQLIVIGVLLAMFFAGFKFDIDWLVTFPAMLLAIIILINKKFGNLTLEIIAGIANMLPFRLVSAPINVANEELKKLLPPFDIVSLGFAFMGAVAAIKGVSFFTGHDLVVWTSVALTLAIFTYYIDSKTRWAGWIMVGLLLYLFTSSYLWPVPTQALLTRIERFSTNRSIVGMDKSNGEELVVLKNSPLYNKINGNRFAYANIERSGTAKLIGRTSDPISKEPMYQIVLPIKGYDDLYIGGEQYFVPARMVKAKQSTDRISEKQFIGRGLCKDGAIPTLAAGRDWRVGQIICVESPGKFQVFHAGAWQNYEERVEIPVDVNPGKGQLLVKAEDGKPIVTYVIKG